MCTAVSSCDVLEVWTRYFASLKTPNLIATHPCPEVGPEVELQTEW
jgi:hypothetical protein